MRDTTQLIPMLALARAWAAMAAEKAAMERSEASELRVLLDCDTAVASLLRSELDFVTYVTDPAEADVRLRVKRSGTRRAAGEHAVEFAGTGRFDGIHASARITIDARRLGKSTWRDVLSTFRDAPVP
jgi:hypothetical protein